MMMRYVPARLSLIDDMFGNSFYKRNQITTMKTDITEKDGSYLFAIELPGFTKEEISIELDEGYLTVSAEKSESEEVKDDQGNVIRQERYSGRYSRSYYIGKLYSDEDITANLENGELKITIKAKSEEEIVTKKTIAIK